MTDTTEQSGPRPGSLGFGLAWMMALALTLCMLPIIGPFLAGVIGGRRIRDPKMALMAALVPLAFMGGTLYAMTRAGIKVGGQEIFLPSGFAWLQCVALAAGVLTGAAQRIARYAGLVLFAVCIAVLQPQARQYRSVLRVLQSAQAVRRD